MKKKILIVEDDEWLAERYQSFLVKVGYSVSLATDALAAIKLIDEIVPDLLILDIMLTNGNALTLIHELQSYNDTAKIPKIVCSNLACDINFSDLKSYGICALLDKSTMSPGDLVKAINEAFDENSSN